MRIVYVRLRFTDDLYLTTTTILRHNGLTSLALGHMILLHMIMILSLLLLYRLACRTIIPLLLWWIIIICVFSHWATNIVMLSSSSLSLAERHEMRSPVVRVYTWLLYARTNHLQSLLYTLSYVCMCYIGQNDYLLHTWYIYMYNKVPINYVLYHFHINIIF